LVNALADVDRVDLWIHTHWDADHVGGFARAIAGADGAWPTEDDLVVDRFWDRGLAGAALGDGLVLYALLAGERREGVAAGADVTIGEATVQSLSFARDPSLEENDRGLALCITLPGLRVLAPGDLPAASVEAAAAACPDADVLWASHHGAIDGISPGVLEHTEGAAVVVSAGPQNPYCHPHPATLGLLHEREVWITRAAGVARGGPCDPIAAALGPEHHIAGGGIWLPLDAR
jgi:competence protein ComEC